MIDSAKQDRDSLAGTHPAGLFLYPDKELKHMLFTSEQVSAEIDYAAWQTLLEGRENARFKLYPGLNHLFMDSLTGTLEDYNTPGNMSPEVIDDIAAWLLVQVE